MPDSESELVVRAFKDAFSQHKNHPIVLYGIGLNTKAILENVKDYNIIGLMDQRTTGETLYGLKVLNFEEVRAARATVVIIARQSVVGVIYKRIRELENDGIRIYDFQGKLLGGEDTRYENEDMPYWSSTEEDLKNKILENEVISFDIFDTLLMRRVLLPTDVFEIVEAQLSAEGVRIPFAKMRREAGETAGVAASIEEIYEQMGEKYHLASQDTHAWMKLEMEVDRSLLLPRRKMRDIFRFALENGKPVYLISDMYYPKEIMAEILAENGYSGWADILVSCDIKKIKEDGTLFRWHMQQVGDKKRFLHIGDNRRADIENAKKSGMSAFQVESAYEMLMASSLQKLLADMDSLKKRCVLGLLAEKMFNDPFALAGKKGYASIEDLRTLGYCFLGPIIFEFCEWLLRKVKEDKVEKMLFPSRDGFLIKRAFDIVAGGQVGSVYFNASRRAVSVANLHDKNDIEKILKRKYSGSFRSLLRDRFGVVFTEIGDFYDGEAGLTAEELARAILPFESQILERAARERTQYMRYLEEAGVCREGAGVFDFVAGGTVQWHLSRLLNANLKGYYFATMNLPNDLYGLDSPDIETAYGNVTSYQARNNLAKYYLFLEPMLGDGQPTFLYVDHNGQYVYDSENPVRNYGEISQIQDGVIAFVGDMKKYFSLVTGEELNFADEIFGSLFSQSVHVDTAIKAIFVNDDSYDGTRNYRVWE